MRGCRVVASMLSLGYRRVLDHPTYGVDFSRARAHIKVSLSRSRTAFRFRGIRFEKARGEGLTLSLPPSGLTLQPHRPIPGISIKMSPERARACKLAFQTARLGAYQRESVCILGCASPTAISRRVWPSLAIASVHFWRSFIV